MFDSCKNTKAQGNIGMGVAIAYYSVNNYTVSIPLTDSQSYDFIIEKEGILYKVQVKTSSFKTKYGIYNVALKTCGGNQSSYNVKCLDKTKIDYLFVMCSDGVCYNIPASAIAGKGNSINMGKNVEEYRVKII